MHKSLMSPNTAQLYGCFVWRWSRTIRFLANHCSNRFLLQITLVLLLTCLQGICCVFHFSLNSDYFNIKEGSLLTTDTAPITKCPEKIKIPDFKAFTLFILVLQTEFSNKMPRWTAQVFATAFAHSKCKMM